MKKLICCSYASKEGYRGSENMQKKNAIDIYLKNACVCCYTAKKHNPDCVVAFVHNMNSIPIEYSQFFQRNEIETIRIPFDTFTFSAECKWSLAFYKLAVMKNLSENGDYDFVAIVDTDTYSIGPLDAIWQVCADRLLLYNVQHAVDLDAYQRRLKEYRLLYANGAYPTVWGGEFIAGSKTLLREFTKECEKVYNKMVQMKFETTFGDEFITYCAAENYAGKIADAAPYIRRYWTTDLYYQTFTDHGLMLRILHIPNEKESGFIWAYKYIKKHQTLPPNKVMFELFGMPSTKRPETLRTIIYRYTNKVRRVPEKIRSVIRKQ